MHETKDDTVARYEHEDVLVEDEEEAVEIANDTESGLYGYVSSGDVEHAKKVANRIRAGSIAINGAGADFTTPFGGYKQSGNGTKR